MMIFGLPGVGTDLERQTAFAGTGLSFEALLNQNAMTASQLTDQRAIGFQEVGMMGLAHATQNVSLSVGEPADAAPVMSSLPMNVTASEPNAHLNDPKAPILSAQFASTAAPQPPPNEMAASASMSDLLAPGTTSQTAVTFELGALPASSGAPVLSAGYAEMVSAHGETALDQKAPLLPSLEMAVPDVVNSNYEPSDTSAASTIPAKIRDAVKEQVDRGAFRVEISNSDDGLNVAVIAPGLARDSSGPLQRRVLDMITAQKLVLAGISINGSSLITYSTANEGGQNGR